MLLETIGVDKVMFETDFPHPTSLYPGVQEHLAETLGGYATTCASRCSRATRSSSTTFRSEYGRRNARGGNPRPHVRESIGARSCATKPIEFAGDWVRWGQLRQHGRSRSARCSRQSRLHAQRQSLFVPHNRPSAACGASCIARTGNARCGWSTRFQSAAGIARDSDEARAVRRGRGGRGFRPRCSTCSGRARRRGDRAERAERGMARSGLELSRQGPSARRSTPPPQIQILTSGTTGPPKAFGMDARHGRAPHREREQELSGCGFDLIQEPRPVSHTTRWATSLASPSALPSALCADIAWVLVERFSVELWRPPLRGGPPARAREPAACRFPDGPRRRSAAGRARGSAQHR